MRKYDLTGQRFGKLVVVALFGQNLYQSNLWLCKCDCGNTTKVTTKDLRRGHSKSCGCRKYGGGNRRLYHVWRTMKKRCEDENEKSYRWYGALGVKVCDKWHDYLAFKEWALSTGYDVNAPQGKCTLDRIDPYGDYEPNNCRWVTMAEQARNKRVRHKNVIAGSEVQDASCD